MSWTPPITILALQDILSAMWNEQVRDNLNFLKTNIALEIAAGLTIDAGVITKTQTHHVIAAESDDEDDLETINGGAYGEGLLLHADTGHAITLKHGVDNIYNPAENDVTITDSSYAFLINNGTNWIVIGGGISEADIQALIDASISAHASIAQTHFADPVTLQLDEDGIIDITDQTTDYFYLQAYEGTDDTLVTINGGQQGQKIYICPKLTNLTIGKTGNIYTSGDLVLASGNYYAELFYDGAYWYVISSNQILQFIQNNGLQFVSGQGLLWVPVQLPDHGFTGSLLHLNPGVSLSFGEAVYITTTSYQCLKAKADDEDTMPAVGLYVGSDNILVSGIIQDNSWSWTPGRKIYISPDTAGGLTQVRPTDPDIAQPIGKAITAVKIVVSFESFTSDDAAGGVSEAEVIMWAVVFGG